jgi:hypothetical protein
MDIPILQYPTYLEQVSVALLSVFSAAQLEYFKKYLTGLFTSANKTIAGINRLYVLNPRNQSSFNRFFTNDNWDKEALNHHRLDLLHAEKHTRPKPSGVVIVDDTHNEKYGEQFEKVAKLYDHSQGCYHLAHDLVTSHYSDEKTDYPLHFSAYEQMNIAYALSLLDAANVPYDAEKLGTYRPSIQRTKIWALFKKHAVEHPFLDKNDQACHLIDQAIEQGFEGPFTFDIWFTVPKVTQHIADRGRCYVGQVKSSRTVLRKDGWQSIGDWTTQLLKDHNDPEHPKYQKVFRKTSFFFKGQKKTYWTFTKVIRVSKLGKQRLVISFKTKKLSGRAKRYVSNNRQASAGEILQIGRHRWPIEPFYEVSKGFLGLDQYELRDFTSVEKHWALVFFAYTIIKLQHPDCLMRSGDDIQITFGDGVRTIQKEIFEALCAYCYECGKQGAAYEEMIKLLYPY